MKIGIFLGGYFKKRFKSSNRSQQGGAEIQTGYLVNEFIKKGHTIFYVCYGDNTQIKPKSIRKSLTLYQIKKPYKNIKVLVVFERKSIINILNREKPDIIYQRGDFHFSDILSKYGHLNNIPIVSALSMEKHCKKIPIKLSIDLPVNIIMNRMMSNYYKYSDIVISQNKKQRDLLKKEFNKDSIILPNGHPKIDNISREKNLNVIWVANFKPIKQPHLFVELAKKFSDRDIPFIMIGRPAIGHFQKKIENEISKVDNLQYLGELSLEETEKMISNSSVLVNTSISEGFSNTFIQAWLNEIPVVSLNSDPDNIIKKYNLGFHSKFFNKLVEDVDVLISNTDLRKDIGKQSREYALKHFDIELIANRYIEIFNELLKSDNL